MAFVKARIEIKPASVGTGVKVSLKKLKASAAKMTVSVTGEAIKTLGWKNGDKLEVLIGEGEHHGLIRLRKNNSIGNADVVERSAVRGGKYLAIALGHQPAFVDESNSALWCQWEVVEDGYCEIVLPAWADKTAPKKRAPTPEAVPGTIASAPSKPRQTVTAGLMGDPAPGRRQMLEEVGKFRA